MPDRPSVPPGHPPLETYLEWLWATHGDEVDSIVLFGSRARGDALDVSDYDLLVALRDEDGLRFTDRIGIYQDTITGKVDVFPYCPSDLATMQEDRNGFLLEVLADGKAIYDRGAWARIRDRFASDLAAGCVKRVPGGWEIR